MARDYYQIIKRVEGISPKSRGTTQLSGVSQSQDEILRRNLVGYANDVLRELEEANRWGRNFFVNSWVTTPGTALYPLPGPLVSAAGNADVMTHVHRLYYRMSSGRVVQLELYDQQEPRWMVGDVPTPANPTDVGVTGKPRWYSIMGTGNLGVSQPSILIFPAPDSSGPDGGNYTLILEYYSAFQQFAESAVIPNNAGVTQTFFGANTGNYLTSIGIPASSSLTGQFCSIRAAGYTNLSGVSTTANEDIIAPWQNLVAASVDVVATVVVGGYCPIMFNSRNWIIDLRPNLLLYGILRNVAAYLKDDQGYSIWEQRFQKELEDAMEWDQQSRHDGEVLAGAVGGQQQRMLQDIDWPNIFDVRGNVL